MRPSKRWAACLLLALLLSWAPVRAQAPTEATVTLPGAGRRTVRLVFEHLQPTGVFVLQGLDGPNAPCWWGMTFVQCTVEAGPLTQITLFFIAEPPSCTARAAVYLQVDDGRQLVLRDPSPGSNCVHLPAVRSSPTA